MIITWMCLDEQWSRVETDYLIELAKDYSCNFLVMHDRYQFGGTEKKRSVEVSHPDHRVPVARKIEHARMDSHAVFEFRKSNLAIMTFVKNYRLIPPCMMLSMTLSASWQEKPGLRKSIREKHSISRQVSSRGRVFHFSRMFTRLVLFLSMFRRKSLLRIK